MIDSSPEFNTLINIISYLRLFICPYLLGHLRFEEQAIDIEALSSILSDLLSSLIVKSHVGKH